MASTPTNPNAPSFRYANALTDPSIHPQVKQFGASVSNALSDIYQAFPALKAQIDAVKTTATQAATAASGVTPSPPIPPAFPGLGGVNNQTGVTAYVTQTNDNGVLLVLSDASPIAISLNSSVTTPYFLFVTNIGAGTATLTPTTGLVNGGASITLLSGASCYAFFDGTNWEAGTAIDASKVVLLNPTGSQTITQPTGTDFKVTGGSDIQLISALITLQAPIVELVAPVDTSGNAGQIAVIASPGATSGSLVQLQGSVALFAGIGFEAYAIVTTSTTLDFTFGGSVAWIDASSGNITFALPNSLQIAATTVPTDSMEIVIVRNDKTPAGNTVTIAATSPSLIQGAASITMSDKTAITLIATTDPSTGDMTWQIQTDTRPSTTFGTGVPASTVPEGSIYFDTTGSPYAGYVYHSGSWHSFS